MTDSPSPVSPIRGFPIFPPGSVGLLCCTHGYSAVGTTCLTILWDGCFLSHSSAPIPLPGFLNLGGTLLYGMTVFSNWFTRPGSIVGQPPKAVSDRWIISPETKRIGIHHKTSTSPVQSPQSFDIYPNIHPRIQSDAPPGYNRTLPQDTIGRSIRIQLDAPSGYNRMLS